MKTKLSLLVFLIMSTHAYAQKCTVTKSRVAMIEVDWRMVPEADKENILTFDPDQVEIKDGYYKLTFGHDLAPQEFTRKPEHSLFEFLPQKGSVPRIAYIKEQCVIYQKFNVYKLLTISVKADPDALKIPIKCVGADHITEFELKDISESLKKIQFEIKVSSEFLFKDELVLKDLTDKKKIERNKEFISEKIAFANKRSSPTDRGYKLFKDYITKKIEASAIIYSIQ